MDAPVEKCLQNYQHVFAPGLLRGKVAFITGGGTGIGFIITEVLMRHGCDTAIASRRMEILKHASGELEKTTGQTCLPVQMDIRKPQDVTAAVDAVLAKFGRIDILVNNAAGNFLCPLSSMSFNAFKTVIDIDLGGTFNASKVVYDRYFKDHGGNIVNISATLHHRGQVFQGHAGPAKAAIDALTKHMAVEWGPQGIRVNGVAPGPISDTEGLRKLGGTDKAFHDERMKDIPLQRAGTREEIAHTVLFLASQAGALITGTTVVADGGACLSQGNSMEEVQRRVRSYQTSGGSKL